MPRKAAYRRFPRLCLSFFTLYRSTSRAKDRGRWSCGNVFVGANRLVPIKQLLSLKVNGLEKWSQCFLDSLRQRRFGSTSARLPLARGRCGLAKRLGSRKGGWRGDISCVLFRGESED